MRSLFANPDALFRFQKILIPSFTLLFFGAVYILFGEVADKLEWNETVYVLALIMAASFWSQNRKEAKHLQTSSLI